MSKISRRIILEGYGDPFYSIEAKSQTARPVWCNKVYFHDENVVTIGFIRPSGEVKWLGFCYKYP